MELKPTDCDFVKWMPCIPSDGDLLFFSSDLQAGLLKNLKVPIFTVEQLKAQGPDLWSLNRRSWYGYALNRSKLCSWLPIGMLETFGRSKLAALAEIQVALELPTLLGNSRLPAEIEVLKTGRHRWVTSKSWKQLSSEYKLLALKAWHKQNAIGNYSTVALRQLPIGIQHEFKGCGLHTLLNSFTTFSGPNCFAATAAMALKLPDLSRLWLHAEPFTQLLSRNSFVSSKSQSPKPRDALIFLRDKQPIHAAYYLGDGLTFEKTGQDFYEPYRIAKLENWRSNWPNSTLRILRRT